MTAPFISLDGADNKGVRAEVWVQTGTAQVTEIKAPRKWVSPDGVESKNWDPLTSEHKPGNVSVKVANDVIREGIQAWVSTSDPVYAMALEALRTGKEVAYRVEWQRNKEADRTTPVKELRGYNEQTKRSDMGMSGQNGKNILAGIDGVLTREAVTNPAEDEAPGGRHSAVGPQAAPAPAAANAGAAVSVEAALTALATARATGMPNGVADAAAAMALAAGASPKQVEEAGFANQTGAQRREAARAHAKEAAPFQSHNTDGRLNLGSQAVTAAFGAQQFAEGRIAAHHALLAGEDGEPAEVDFAQSVGLANVLLGLADRVQTGTYGGGRADRMSSSHTRARSLVYRIIEDAKPIPFGADADERAAWADAVVAEAVARFAALAQIAFAVEDAAPVQQQAPQQQSAPAEAPQQGEAPAQPQQQAPVQAQQARPKPPVQGEDGFVAPSPETVVAFGTLANDAGFTAEDPAPIVAYLTEKFGVDSARKVHGEALAALVGWYERHGDDAARVFRGHVMNIASKGEGTEQSAAS